MKRRAVLNNRYCYVFPCTSRILLLLLYTYYYGCSMIGLSCSFDIASGADLCAAENVNSPMSVLTTSRVVDARILILSITSSRT